MATANTPNSQATASQVALNQFLAIAPTKSYSIYGTVPSGVSGGSTANVTWQQQIPIIPAFCTSIDYTITLPVTLTLGATTGAATLSNFAPYSAAQNQITLGGAPPWNMTEFTPWYLDDLTRAVNYDPAYVGLGNNTGWFSTVLDQGPSPIVIGGSGSLAPGTTVTNTTTSATNTNYTWAFKVRQQLQRRRKTLWGAVPFGDPENRPNNLVQLSPLIGTNPESSLFTQAAGTGTACVTNGNATVNAKYNLQYIDLLYPGMTAAPSPSVVFGLQLTTSSPSGLTAGNIYPLTHRTAQLYQTIHHILVNNQAPLQSDYFGLWDDQDQQSARWAYDASQNTFEEYFHRFHRIYGRYPFKGHYMVDYENLDSNSFPPIPGVSPYMGAMTPDANYAGAFQIPVTPAMTTAIRVPSVTSINSAYVRLYSFGLVKVPY